MRMSCNGCRVLRKGCTEDCTLRPCLQWIKTPESQANATVFLAKFYGRAGLVNLINAGPDHLRPAIFRSLLYEACGRIINPIYGSVGLMWGGNWDRCQEAVEAVLSGSEITKIPIEDGGGAEPHSIPPFKGCDIRHISKEASPAVRRVKSRNRFKRTGLAEGSSAAGNVDSLADAMEEPEKFSISGWGFDGSDGGRFERAASHGSSSLELAEPYGLGEEKPVGTGNELMLDLTLGFSAGDQATNPPWMSTQ